jgi:hypothetical protein
VVEGAGLEKTICPSKSLTFLTDLKIYRAPTGKKKQ